MEKVVTNKSGSFLIPNKEHQNFTDSSTKFRTGTPLVGEFKIVKGKRRGQDFDYRLFFTMDGNILYADCVNSLQPQTRILSNIEGDAESVAVLPDAFGYGVATATGQVGNKLSGGTSASATTSPNSGAVAVSAEDVKNSEAMKKRRGSFINPKEEETSKNITGILMLGLGAGAGFLYSKNKKLSTQNTLLFTIGGGIVLWGIYKTFTTQNKD